VRKHLGDGYTIGLGHDQHHASDRRHPGWSTRSTVWARNRWTSRPPGDDIKAIYADMNMQYGDFNLVFKAPARTQAGAAAVPSQREVEFPGVAAVSVPGKASRRLRCIHPKETET